MASYADTSPATACELSTPGSSKDAARSRTSSFFRNRFSNASNLSHSSARTLLPRYSFIDAVREPLANPVTTSCASDSPPPIEPPRYSLPQHQLTMRASTASSFEIEGEPQAQKLHYSYPIRPKNAWATLHLHTRVAVPGTQSDSLENQPRLPRFWSCDSITGAVQLDLDTPQNIQRISITVNGSIILSSQRSGSLPFLKHEYTVWDKSMDPLRSDTNGTDRNSTEKQENGTRLASGQYTFPFSFLFPTQADPINSITPLSLHTGSTSACPTSDDGDNNTEKRQRSWTRGLSTEPPSSHPPTSQFHRSLVSPIPQTFLEKEVEPNVAYGISVRIVHGRFKTSSKIKTSFTYVPASEPLPMLQKRREAYEAGALLPCPMNDPEGWLALPTATTYGMVEIDHNSLHARVDCTLYIAQPLTYTRGSLIPCFITIHGDQVTHLLPSTEMSTVKLVRRVWHPSVTDSDESPARHHAADHFGSLASYVMVQSSELKVVTHEVGRANWWIPSKDVVLDPNTRHLEGEIHLSPALQPSCSLRSFRIEYAVELLSFQTATFTPEVYPTSPGNPRTGNNVMASNPVEITTMYREGEPIPNAYSEPPKTYYRRRVY